MNERIRQLAEKTIGANPKYAVAMIYASPELEKFAKLLLQECIDILPEKVQIDDLYDGRILVQCGMAIKEHFGVE